MLRLHFLSGNRNGMPTVDRSYLLRFQFNSSSRMIMVYRDSYRSKEKANDYRKPDYISLGCAIENMSLQAIHLGLGSCILCDTLYIEKEIDDYLNISDYEQICGFIVGYPIYDYPPKKKRLASA